MLKKSIYITIAIFSFVGFFYMFIIDINVNNIKKDAQNKNIKKINNINNYLISNDINLKSFAKKITSPCSDNNTSNYKSCNVLEIYKYIRSSFIIDNTELNNDEPNILQTLKDRQGNILEISLLYSSLLLHSGIATYVKKNNDKLYNYACGIDNIDMYNTIKEDLHSKPLVNKALSLRKGQIWAYDLTREDDSNLVIDVEFFSKYPFDIILFPNKEEMNAYINNQYGRYNEDCSLFGVSEFIVSCNVPKKTGIIMFKSLEDDNKFTANIYKGGILLGDIKSEKSKQGNNCIQIDINSTVNIPYPGIIN